MDDVNERKRINIIESLNYAKANYFEVNQGINISREGLDETDRNVNRMISESSECRRNAKIPVAII